MNAQSAIRGLLVGHAQDYADNSIVLTVKVERLQFASFAPSVGVPKPGDAIGNMPSVMMLACETPQHPETDEDVMAVAAIAWLEDLFRRRLQPLTRKLLGGMGEFVATMRGLLEAQDEPAGDQDASR